MTSSDHPSKARLVDAMRQLPGGVCVITAGRVPRRTGYTGTAVFSLSVDPERIAISIGRAASSLAPIREFGDFGLNILSVDQQAVADRFAGRGGEKGEARFADADWRLTPRGVSLLEGALARVECRVEEILERHSHAIVVAEPIGIVADSSAPGLIYWRSGYSYALPIPRLAVE